MCRAPPSVEFTGELHVVPSDYHAAVSLVCGKCTDAPCGVCYRPFLHRAIALQQPFPSVACKPPRLYLMLFPSTPADKPIPYHTLVMGYSAVHAHIQKLLNPEAFWLSTEWTFGAKQKRTEAALLYANALQLHRRDMTWAYAQTDHVLGRRCVVNAYQAVIVCGLNAMRAENREDMDAAVAEHMNVLNAALEECPAAAVDEEIQDFNAAQAAFFNAHYQKKPIHQ